MAENDTGDSILSGLLPTANPLLGSLNAVVTQLGRTVQAIESTSTISPEPKAPVIPKDNTPPVQKALKPEDKISFGPNVSPDTQKTFLDFLNGMENPNGIDVTNPTLDNLNHAVAIMGSKTDINEKLQAALAVSSLGEQLVSIRMKNYMDQANAALGIADINKQIEIALQADLASPNNPGDGTHSVQTQALIDRKTELIKDVPNLARQYAQMDSAIAAPIAAADAVLKGLPAIERLDFAREKNRERAALINTVTDTEAKNYAAMTGDFGQVNWNDPTSVFAIKKQYYNDKEFQKLAQTNLLSVNDGETARQLYAMSDSPLDKNRSFSILKRLEADSLDISNPSITGEEKARRLLSLDENMRLVRAAFDDRNLSDTVRKKIENTVNSAGLTGKDKTSRLKELEYQAKEDLLKRVVVDNFVSDVSQWRGLNNTDPAVNTALQASRKLIGKQAVPMDVFVTQYLEQNPENLTYRQRLQKLQSYILSSVNNLSNSAVMPQIDGLEIWNKVAPSATKIWLKTILEQ